MALFSLYYYMYVLECGEQKAHNKLRLVCELIVLWLIKLQSRGAASELRNGGCEREASKAMCWKINR